MTLPHCQALLAGTLATTRCSAPEETLNGRLGTSVLRMASAYESDGGEFFSGGDPVNALAAFLYGFGWLHCGIAAGLLVTSGRPGCPFGTGPAGIPGQHRGKLEEKTGRYARLLTTALASVTPSPDAGTPPYEFAGRVTFIADLYLSWGTRLQSAGAWDEALACYSYGHGWLDAGVQAGLFAIRANREIFTVD